MTGFVVYATVMIVGGIAVSAVVPGLVVRARNDTPERSVKAVRVSLVIYWSIVMASIVTFALAAFLN